MAENNSTGLLGVYRAPHRPHLYTAQAYIGGQTVSLGYHKTPKEAGMARDWFFRTAAEDGLIPVHKLKLNFPTEASTPTEVLLKVYRNFKARHGNGGTKNLLQCVDQLCVCMEALRVHLERERGDAALPRYNKLSAAVDEFIMSL